MSDYECRLEKLRPKAIRLRELGFTYQQIADALNLPRHAAEGLINDRQECCPGGRIGPPALLGLPPGNRSGGKQPHVDWQSIDVSSYCKMTYKFGENSGKSPQSRGAIDVSRYYEIT